MIIFHGPLFPPFSGFLLPLPTEILLSHWAPGTSDLIFHPLVDQIENLRLPTSERPSSIAASSRFLPYGNGRINPKSYLYRRSWEKNPSKIIRSLCFSLLAKVFFWFNFIYTAQSQIVSKISPKLQVLSSGFSSKAEAKSFRQRPCGAATKCEKSAWWDFQVWHEGMNKNGSTDLFEKKKENLHKS